LPSDHDFSGVDRVVGKLHLVDGHAVRGKIDGFADTGVPILLRLADHTGDEVDIDVGEANVPDPFVRFIDLGAFVSTTVLSENSVVEILDA
jgi:hypothetical protein